MNKTKAGPAALGILLASCTAAAPPTTPTTPRTPVVTTKPIPAVWSWTASTGGAWRLPIRGFGITVVDDARAIVTSTGGTAMLVDLTTGAVGAPVELLAPTDSLDSIVRIGDQLVGFGAISIDTPAAWTITLSPFAATPLAIPDGERDPAYTPAGDPVVSPDGSKLVLCGRSRYPTVRDATTLAVIRSATGVECGTPRFAGDDRVVFDNGDTVKELVISTGVVTDRVAGAPELHAGPSGLMFAQTGLDYRIDDPAGGFAQGHAVGFGRVRWSSDGAVAVQVASGTVGIYPSRLGTGATPRAIDVSVGAYRFDVAGRTAVVIDSYLLYAVDLYDGSVRTADGNLGTIRRIQPRAGMVVSLSDRIRAWRDGALVAAGESKVRAFAFEPGGDKLATLSPKALATWIPGLAAAG